MFLRAPTVASAGRRPSRPPAAGTPSCPSSPASSFVPHAKLQLDAIDTAIGRVRARAVAGIAVRAWHGDGDSRARRTRLRTPLATPPPARPTGVWRVARATRPPPAASHPPLPPKRRRQQRRRRRLRAARCSGSPSTSRLERRSDRLAKMRALRLPFEWTRLAAATPQLIMLPPPPPPHDEGHRVWVGAGRVERHSRFRSPRGLGSYTPILSPTPLSCDRDCRYATMSIMPVCLSGHVVAP